MKRIVVLMFCVITALSAGIFVACNDAYANVNLKPSTNFIELEVGETTSFSVAIENYFGDMSGELAVNVEGDIVDIQSISNDKNGVSEITVLGLKVGSGNLSIRTLEGAKSCVVGVTVKQAVKSFSLKTTPYLIQEENLSYDFSDLNWFSFEPANATKAPVSYYYDNNGLSEKIIGATSKNEGGKVITYLITETNKEISILETTFSLTAKLDAYPDVNSVIFDVDIIQPIEYGNLTLIKEGLYNSEYIPLNQREIINENSLITIITNSQASSYFEFELDIKTPNVSVQINSLKTEAGKVVLAENVFTPISAYSYIFGLQARSTGSEIVEIKLFYENYEGYEKTIQFNVEALTAPSSIYVNDKTSSQSLKDEVILYDANYGENAYTPLNIAVYSTDSVFDSVEVEILKVEEGSQTPVPFVDWTNFLLLSYKNQTQSFNFTLPYEDFENNYLMYPLILAGKQIANHQIFIKLTLKSNLIEENSITHFVPIEIKEGATSFKIAPNYVNGISLDLSAGEQYFGGLMIESDNAYIGNYTFEYINNSNHFFEVRQVAEGNKNIYIKPIAVGAGSLKITLPNGLPVTLVISVEVALEKVNLSVVQNDYISLTQTDNNQNLNQIAVNFTLDPSVQQKRINLELKLLTNPTNATLYSVEDNILNGEDIIAFNKTTFELSVVGVGEADLEIIVYRKQIEDFNIIGIQGEEEGIKFRVHIIVFSPITDFSFEEDGKKITQTEMFRSADIGAYYQNQGLATYEVDFKATLWDGSKPEDLFNSYRGKISWTTQFGEPNETYSSSQDVFMSEGTITNFGHYFIEGNHLKLICDDEFAMAGTSFWIAFTITEYDFSVTCVLNISIETYVPLTFEYLGFYNFQDEVYLSDQSKTFVLNSFITAEADCREYDAIFIPTGNTPSSLISVSVNSDFNQISVTYNGYGTGYGSVVIIPRTAYEANGAYDIQKTKSFTVRVSDGSDKNNPLAITSAEGFISVMRDPISLEKHFKITQALDFSGINITSCLGEFNGSLVGEGGSAKIVNLNLSASFVQGSKTYLGLFSKIGERGEISNLIFEGAFDYNIQTINNVSAGLIAGENNGVIKNVSVILKKSNFNLDNAEDIYSTSEIALGAIVGINNGVIINEVNKEKQTSNHTLIYNSDEIKATYRGYSQTTYFGGVCGINNGIINRIIDENTNIYNSAIYSARVNLTSLGFNATGGVSGLNNLKTLTLENYENYSSSIKNMIIDGTITVNRFELNETTSIGGINAGGVVGINHSYVQSNITRAFISGYDYVGGITGRDSTFENYISSPSTYEFIKNNSVQAIYQTSFKYMLTAINSSGNIGAISGNENSTLNRLLYAPNNTAQFYYEMDAENKIYPMAYGKIGTQFNSIKYDTSDANYSIFKYENALVEIEKIENDYVLGAGKLESENPVFDNKIAYMFYYGAENLSEQKYVDYLNLGRDVPFVFKFPDSVTVSSLNRDILNIDNSGRINIYSTGLAVLQVSSILNNTKGNTYLYVYVTNAFDGYQLTASNGSVLTNGSVVVVYESAPIEIKYNFTHTKIEAEDDYNRDLKVELSKNQDASLTYKVNEATEYIKITSVGNSLIFALKGIPEASATNTVTFIPIFNLSLENIGNVHMFEGDEEHAVPSEMDKLITSEEQAETSIIALAKKGTEKFELNYSQIRVEPLDLIEVDINQVTDYESDTLKISFLKIGENIENFDYFIIEDFSGYNYNESENLFEYQGSSGKFKFSFNYELYALDGQDYSGTYFINFTADNQTIQTLIVEVVMQEVSNILLKNYYNVTGGVDKIKAEQNFVAVNANSVLQIDVFPYFADYDFIRVENATANQDKGNSLILEVISHDENGEMQTVYGVNYFNGGVDIPLSVIKNNITSQTNAQIFVKYTTTSTALENSKADLIVSAIKVNAGEESVQFKTTKTINVIVKDTVEFKIKNKEMVNGKYYVAKGLTYDLDLTVYGFSSDQIVIKSSSNYAGIYKDNDGSYVLKIANDINYISGQEGYELTITTYGESVVDGLYYTSDKVELKLVIVDFVILMDKIKPLNLTEKNYDEFDGVTVVEYAENGLLRVAIGNTTSLGVKLLNGVNVEYNASSTNIVNAVKNFERALSVGAEWGIRAKQAGIAGAYITKTTFENDVYINNEYLRITSDHQGGGKYIYNYSPLKLTTAENALYNLTFNASFEYLNGVPVLTPEDSKNANSLQTDIAIEVYATGLENNAIPVYTYEDLIAMKEDLWYIQLADISLPADFVPLSTKIAGLNGNGYSITFENNSWFVENSDEVGLFSTLNSGSVLKNINFHFSESVNIQISNPRAFNFGFFAGVNLGTITNCSITTDELVTVSVSISGQGETITDNYVAGIAGLNQGFITHSRVSLTLVSSTNLAGITGVNENIIASSYVANTKLINKSGDVVNKTAGFAIRNGVTANSSSPAIIQTSYVSGAFTSSTVYSTGSQKAIVSDTQVAGFVFQNYGDITSCYANIPIFSNSIRSGFAYENAGNIKDCYSTSTFGQTGQTAYGFLVLNQIGSFEGTCENCYYLLGLVNATVNKTTVDGVRGISEIEFAMQSIFETFIFSSSSEKTNGVWFYPSLTAENEFRVNGQAQQFIYGKPELVAPNIVATTQKSLDTENIKVDPQTGNTTYVYIETKQTEGSVYNPYTIYTASDFEALIQAGSNNNINTSFYRIVCDLDYEKEKIYNSKLYKTIFKGNLEGNGMTIKGYVIDTKESLPNGGLFAKVGNGATGEGIIKNLNLAPKYINMPNTSNVGALAGSLESGSLFNVNVFGFNYDTNGLVIIGHYCVGGIVGVAINDFKINQISSSISARASYDSSLVNESVGIYTKTKTTAVSYAGALIGVSNNSGEIKNASVSNKIAAMAEIAGLMFGKIGNNVSAENIDLVVSANQFVRASSYGGAIAGELSGSLTNARVSGVMQDFFKVSPIVPKVIGGAVGFVHNGNIKNVSFETDLTFQNATPSVVGGIVGETLGGEIKNATFKGNMNFIGNTELTPTTSLAVGALVGRTSYQPVVNLTSFSAPNKVDLISCKTLDKSQTEASKINVQTDSLYRISLGGLVGESVQTSETFRQNTQTYSRVSNTLTLNGCENNLDITINSVIYDGTYYGYIGGLVGASFAGVSKSYASEIMVYDNQSASTIYELYESSSHSKITIGLKNMKNEGYGILRYGGIIGYGTPVSDATAVLGTPTGKLEFGEMLENVPDEKKKVTAPSYDGQYKIDSNGTQTPITNMATSGYLTLPEDSIKLSLILEQNNFFPLH